MRLSALHIYPVKSLRGLAVKSAEIDSLGAVGDRRFLIVESSGVFLTQRTIPRMALIGAFLDEAFLELRCEGFEKIRIDRAPDPKAPLVPVRVWSSEGLLAEHCGDAPAAWLSAVLGFPCRLVRIGPAFRRPVKKNNSGDEMAFADGYPFLVTSKASLLDVNRRIEDAGGKAVPMNRFRPNLVLDGCGPYEEDSWKRIRIGNVTLRSAGPCARCIITTTDQLTGGRGKEPLMTLAGYRRDPDDPANVNFGQNLIHESKTGVIRVGDTVEVL
jgi:uncharacterized protein YcbX